MVQSFLRDREHRARHACVVGIQWGDEGKGKIVDVLSAEADVVVRFQGGANAGHTVKVGSQEYILHLIPSGILQAGKRCVIGNGVVVDPKALIAELDKLRTLGIDHESSIFVSDRAHVVMPYHRALDVAKEKASGDAKLGTTLRGIGPCYTDKIARLGIRMADLVRPERFRALVEHHLPQKNSELMKLYGEPALELEPIIAEYAPLAERLRPRVHDIAELLYAADRSGEKILFEGAQGALLDVDFGTYPYVTSSNTSFLGIGTGTGFSPRRVGTVLGVAKAYSTRVGSGPFPTELEGAAAESLRRIGAEFGATTGRPRRCGWLDLVALRRTIRTGDVDALVITKLDVLDGLDEILVGVGYRIDEREISEFPVELDDGIEPIYRDLPGWSRSVRSCRTFESLPVEAKAYLQFIADETACPIAMVSVGKERSETIHIDPWLSPRM
jgi:adenylosuccinate synthase